MLRHLAPRLRLVSALLLLALPAAQAQQARSTPQPPPGVVTYSGARFTLTLMLQDLRDAPDERTRLAERIAGCGYAAPVASADSLAIQAIAFDALSLGSVAPQDVIELVIAPRPARPIDCGAFTASAGLFEARAVWVARDSAVGSDRRIVSVSLSRGSAAIAPLALSRIPVRVFGDSGTRELGVTAIRLALPLAELMPSQAAPDELLRIDVQFEANTPAEVLTVPWLVLRELWDATMERRAGVVARQTPRIALPDARDDALQQAVEAYAAGDANLAARITSARLRTGALSNSDLVLARTLSATVFADAGDALAARVHTDHLLRLEPCFAFSPAASAFAIRAVNDAARPVARCTALPLKRVAARALVFPGFGRPTSGPLAPGPGVFVAALIAGAAWQSQQHRMDARGAYRDYLEYQFDPSYLEPGYLVPEASLARARSLRQRGIDVAKFGAAVYVLQIGVAVLAERRWDKHLTRISRFGRSVSDESSAGPALSVAPVTNGLGLGLRWSW